MEEFLEKLKYEILLKADSLVIWFNKHFIIPVYKELNEKEHLTWFDVYFTLAFINVFREWEFKLECKVLKEIMEQVFGALENPVIREKLTKSSHKSIHETVTESMKNRWGDNNGKN